MCILCVMCIMYISCIYLCLTFTFYKLLVVFVSSVLAYCFDRLFLTVSALCAGLFYLVTIHSFIVSMSSVLPLSMSCVCLYAWYVFLRLGQIRFVFTVSPLSIVIV